MLSYAMKSTVVLIAFLFAACTQNTSEENSKKAEQQPIEALLKEIDTVNGQCRGGSGDDPKTMDACNKREAKMQEAEQRGWCWGPQTAVGADKHWMRCADDKTTSVQQPLASCKSSEASAVNRLKNKIASENIYSSWIDAKCLSFDVEACDGKVIDIGIHEIHGNGCKGDPQTRPRVDSFRMYISSEQIDWYHPLTADYVSFENIHSKLASTQPEESFPKNIKKTWSYKPFSILSTKYNKQMDDVHIAKTFLCRTPTATLEATTDLFKNYDVIGSSKTDGTLTVTSFRGIQQGEKITVSLAVDEQSEPRLVRYILIDGIPALSCQ